MAVMLRVKQNRLINEQHSFQKSRSTEINLIVFSSQLIDVAKSGNHIDDIYMNLKKAFVSVDHRILYMLKLNKLSIGDPLLS